VLVAILLAIRIAVDLDRALARVEELEDLPDRRRERRTKEGLEQ
jgi:hypothetical protein